MTMLHKPVRRELPVPIDRCCWIMEAHPQFVRFRMKRSRRAYDVPWSTVWTQAIYIAAEALKAERKKARKARRCAI